MDISEAIRLGYEKVRFARGRWFERTQAQIGTVTAACPLGAAYIGLLGTPIVSMAKGAGVNEALTKAWPWLDNKVEPDCDCFGDDPPPAPDIVDHLIHQVDEHKWSPRDVCSFLDNYTRAGGAK